MGQDSRSRKARLQQVLSQIYDKMNLQSLSLRYHNAAMAYASYVQIFLHSKILHDL